MIISLKWIWACGGPSRPKYTAWNWKLATLKLTLILKQIEIEKLEILIENHWKVRKCKLLILLATFHYRARESPKIKKSKTWPVRPKKSMHLSSFIEPYLAHIVTAQMLFLCIWRAAYSLIKEKHVFGT